MDENIPLGSCSRKMENAPILGPLGPGQLPKEDQYGPLVSVSLYSDKHHLHPTGPAVWGSTLEGKVLHFPWINSIAMSDSRNPELFA